MLVNLSLYGHLGKAWAAVTTAVTEAKSLVREAERKMKEDGDWKGQVKAGKSANEKVEIKARKNKSSYSQSKHLPNTQSS